MVQAVEPRSDDTVVVAGAAGGVGSIAVQLLRRLGVRVIGVAGAGNDGWLTSVGVQPVSYGDSLDARLGAAAPDGIDAVLDAHGGGYVQQSLEWGVPPARIVTIVDFQAAAEHGARTVYGHQVATAAMLGELAGMIDRGELTIPVAATYDLDEVQAAYTRLAERHTRGKIVLRLAE